MCFIIIYIDMFYKYIYIYNMFLYRSVHIYRHVCVRTCVGVCGCVGACECVYISSLRIKVLNHAYEIIIL